MSTWHTWTGVGRSSGQLCGGWLCGGRLSGGCWFGSWFVQLVDEASCTGYPMILQHLYTYTYMQNKHALHNALPISVTKLNASIYVKYMHMASQ